MDYSNEDLSLFYLVTSFSFFNALIPTLVSLLLNVVVWDTPVETSLKRQVSDLKEELGSVNMTDEFAKYSKIQRKLNKATDELRNKNNRQFIYQTKTKIFLYAILYGISMIWFASINYKHYGKPVLFLPDNLFYPLGFVFGFPTGQSNCLSVFTWSFISGYAFRIFLRDLL